jgi:hypothetical protein
MTHKSKSPNQRDMPGAEECLPTIRFAFDSGNYCDVTIGRVAADAGECRIAVEYAWRNNPTSQEIAEAEAEIESMGLKGPEFVVTTAEGETSQRNSELWLTKGEKPKPERVQ